MTITTTNGPPRHKLAMSVRNEVAPPRGDPVKAKRSGFKSPKVFTRMMIIWVNFDWQGHLPIKEQEIFDITKRALGKKAYPKGLMRDHLAAALSWRTRYTVDTISATLNRLLKKGALTTGPELAKMTDLIKRPKPSRK